MGFEKTFMVGWYDEVIGALVRDYKYNSVRVLATTLASLLDDILPVFKDKIVLVPLPTISPHIRQRGFDHIGLIAKKLAKMRGWEIRRCLGRRKNSVQVGASSNTRKRQAKQAYELIGEIKKEEVYLLVDDVWTTGASMREAAKILKKAGAKRVMIVVLAVNRGCN